MSRKYSNLIALFFLVLTINAAPATASIHILHFPGGDCAGTPCSLSIDDQTGTILAIDRDGKEGSGRVSEKDPSRIYIRWGSELSHGSLSYSNGVIQTIYWDGNNHMLWGNPSECGTVGGTTENQIRDCASKIPGSSKSPKGVEWNLVKRMRDPSSGRIYESWRDSKTGLVWGDRLMDRMVYSHFEAVAIASNGTVKAETACLSEEGKRANADVSDRKFGLPTAAEFSQAQADGSEAAPNWWGYNWEFNFTKLVNYFWSATLGGDRPNSAWGFGVQINSLNWFAQSTGLAVRCVGRQ